LFHQSAILCPNRQAVKFRLSFALARSKAGQPLIDFSVFIDISGNCLKMQALGKFIDMVHSQWLVHFTELVDKRHTIRYIS